MRKSQMTKYQITGDDIFFYFDCPHSLYHRKNKTEREKQSLDSTISDVCLVSMVSATQNGQLEIGAHNGQQLL